MCKKERKNKQRQQRGSKNSQALECTNSVTNRFAARSSAAAEAAAVAAVEHGAVADNATSFVNNNNNANPVTTTSKEPESIGRLSSMLIDVYEYHILLICQQCTNQQHANVAIASHVKTVRHTN